ncbi:hypothetical protein JKA74_05505 [Marivirga sp. S37H4]|uniref:Uncharacterized protein n=1 Tax=Marivirga aurantiaca TaxID=2802615 RepID=A0A934WX12_9BACT|nr:hypothetical protein [Marivirga aurantiaca]MBK6264486.1 hypothetical protein [Marivirga aurantiaca]
MIDNLALPPEWRALMQYLEEAKVRNEIKTFPLKSQQFSRASKQLIMEVMEDLGVPGSRADKINFSFSVIYLFEHQKHLIFEPDYCFNRYRIITLRSSLYDKFHPLDIQKVRGFCRTKEKEALKSGLKTVVWDNPSGKIIFGPSEQPGDFGGSGSSGWKYIALCNFLMDLYCEENNLFLKRITPYDSLMKEVKIHQISTPLKLKDVLFKEAIQKYISRLMKLDLSLS